ncbi:N-acetyl-gamma-glutamyl-phosphate reductase [Ileibacterium valens]|uniref:N-acetyl-gamma-glutamyl-phosphate reductase n=1 Tax=Ileibacterium valens TaxID=1862668 RepID=UPI0023564A86|nr:N-acetyl-gamma-glutamyl-phosphate reductase [Ileibacterium valens]
MLESRPKVYVDGQAGTTGLQIISRLKDRDDIELLLLDDKLRHDDKARKEMMKKADLIFLCLPDQAAIDAVKLCDPSTKIIDASTAHRTNPDWAYGFPELSENHKKKIINSRLVANPGCHASGFIAMVYPLIASGLLDPSTTITSWSLTGYTGGGKKMIHEFEEEKKLCNEAPAWYGLNLMHKHIPEMMNECSLKTRPLFVPIVDDYPCGMLTGIAFNKEAFSKEVSPEFLRKFFSDFYRDALTIKAADEPDSGRLEANRLAHTDLMEIHVNGNEDQILISALFDNLGKGASGAAVENMNLMLGLKPEAGLNL